MPTYEYQCQKCGHEFEKFQSITAKQLRKCPACKQMSLKRLIGTGTGVIFKGSGFYQTDYRTESYTKDQQAEKKTTQPAEKKTETKDKTTVKTKKEAPSKKKSE